ncbi:kinase-like domain-containing protein [Jackrogersella minutella]|nr:kinase-like domain-containing protein [Jackrogersella minutella]
MTPGTGAIQRESWAKQEHQYIKRYFERDTRNFKYEGILGYGATNVACKVKLRHRWWRYSLPSETFVVKRAFVPDQDAILKNEHRIIKRHRGALHIVQPYELPRTIANPLDRAERYTILLEHLENGSLSDFISRKQLWGHELPNRMLFKMFMCLVRACMAMAWPPRAPRGRRVMREGIPDDPEERQNKEQLTHRDMHTGNILLGELDIAHWEHITTPILKLIDFERAVIVEDPAVANPGVSRNILGIGKVMREIVTGNRYAYIRETTIRVNGFPEEIRSFAHLPEDRYPNLDDELRTLIVQCCAADLDQRPTLEELYVRVRECIVARPSRVYPRYPLGQYETDRAIRRIARRLIFDAPV